MDVGAFFARSVPRDRRRIPICADQHEIARTPLGVLYASGTAVAIRRSAEPQMQRTAMFLFKTLGLL